MSIIVRGTNLHRVGPKLQRARDIIPNTVGMRGFEFDQNKTFRVHFFKLRRPRDEPLLSLNDNEILYESTVKSLAISKIIVGRTYKLFDYFGKENNKSFKGVIAL